MTLPLLSVCVILAAGPAKARPEPSVAPPKSPLGITRSLVITDANAREVHPLRVAAGQPTWLLLPAPLAGQIQVPPELGAGQLTGNIVIFTPPQALGSERRVALFIPLSDGPPVIFEVQGGTDSFDARVSIERKLGALMAQDSPQVLGERLQQCRDELQEARTGAAAKEVLTTVISDLGDSQTPALVRRNLDVNRKQNFVYVRLQQSYRLFHWTFVVLELENRDAGTLWSLGEASVRQMGSDNLLTASVRDDRPTGIKGGERSRVVLGFATPADNTKRYAITLTDKAGARNLTLEDLDL